MAEFSRRLNIEMIKDEPLSRDEFISRQVIPLTALQPAGKSSTEVYDEAYQRYLDRFQPYRWRAVAANNEPIAHGESYFNEVDAVNAANLLAGDDTTVYVMPMYGDDRSEKVLRFGSTDRKSMEPPF